MSTSVNPNRSRAGLAGLTLPRPRLTVVPKVVARTPRTPFLMLVVAVLATGLVGLLLLNTSMERGAYQVTALRNESDALSIEQQALQLRVAALQDPQEVAEKALRLGMVQNLSPAFLSLATGQVIGRSVPGAAGAQADVGTKIGPSVDRLAKIAPVVGGEANNAGTAVVRHPARAATKSGDTTGKKSR
ncbi:MAG: hypothetical protein M3O94_07375 [Actinomycetota bacterium]|nr:hypothetical protein [Actinomycetota bacterium]